MRPIKFKAKRLDNGEWVDGSLISSEKDCLICSIVGYYNNTPQIDPRVIDPNTLCQFTGLVDIDRVEVYEHDIIMTEICLMVVVYVATSASFGAVPLKQFNELSDKSNISTDDMYWFDNDIVDLGLYGNIHDKTGER